ncbi:hypothetical protein [Prevotella nigrescens]|uniref:hypothetical protein n=1 Tax=Prevotella nigrescens TaxID=28133 RepID=UPI001E4DD3C2|nr:hypothetical protein [Prevotella nigrescens]
MVAIQRVLGHYVDTFSYYSPMAIRNDNEAYQHIAYSPIFPKFKVTDILRRNGFKDNFYGIVPTQRNRETNLRRRFWNKANIFAR